MAAWNDNIDDDFWKLVKNTASNYLWSLQFVDESYMFVNQYGTPIFPRDEILSSERNNYTTIKKGNLDRLHNWHNASLSFWNNFKVNAFLQRLLFAHIHQSEILTNIGGFKKPYPICHVCNTPATWNHVFTSCDMCDPELTLLYSKWDDLSSLHNMPLVRLPNNHSTAHINMSWNGIIYFNPDYPPFPADFCRDIYCAFASFIGSCYKNCTWNSSSVLRDKRGYVIKPRTDSFQTAWDRANLPSQPEDSASTSIQHHNLNNSNI